MKKVKDICIQCPRCSAQYLPSEIFIFSNKQTAIKDDDTHQIIEYPDMSDEMIENYTCDFCNTTFTVKASMTFQTSVNPIFDVNNNHITKLSKSVLKMSEV